MLKNLPLAATHFATQVWTYTSKEVWEECWSFGYRVVESAYVWNDLVAWNDCGWSKAYSLHIVFLVNGSSVRMLERMTILSSLICRYLSCISIPLRLPFTAQWAEIDCATIMIDRLSTSQYFLSSPTYFIVFFSRSYIMHVRPFRPL